MNREIELKLKAVKSKVEAFKKNLSKAPMRENLGRKEVRALQDLIGKDLYARGSMGQLLFTPITNDFDNFVDNL